MRLKRDLSRIEARLVLVEDLLLMGAKIVCRGVSTTMNVREKGTHREEKG